MLTTEEARKKWVEALRSGKYKQSRQFLHSEEGYCCLGVACDIFAKELSIERKEEKSLEYFNGQSYSLPLNVKNLLGLCGVEGMNLNPNKPCLSYLNDKEELTFDQIADKLETGEYWVD